MRKSWLVVCLINFLIAAVMGLLLRVTQVFPLDIEYRYLIHAHSHSAMFGWVYMIIYSLFVQYFVPADKMRKYNTLFWLTQLTVVGMMLFFPIQGYGLFSITFSSLHIVCSYFFSYWIWKDKHEIAMPVRKLLGAALLFMLLSTAGAWSLGIIANVAGKQSALYKSAIQFFLHFQLNGWFVTAVLAILFAMLIRANSIIQAKRFNVFYTLLVASVVLTVALPLSWFYALPALYYIHMLGLILQIAALAVFLTLLLPNLSALAAKFPAASNSLLILSVVSISVKIILQVASVIPEVAVAAYKVRHFTIGFIHLAMLGLITGFIFFFLAATEIKVQSNFWKSGILLFYTGFLVTEALLFTQGTMTFVKLGTVDYLPNYLLAASILLPAGLLLIVLAALKRS